MARQRISRSTLAWFRTYVRFYLGRNFHAVRLAGRTRLNWVDGWPLIVCMNHPSWWDPLVALHLSHECLPGRGHYAPIESGALGKYKFFARLGFFGVETGTTRGAAAFLRVGAEILSDPSNVLWVTAQGHFADVRERPLELRGGVGHLIRRLRRVAVLPLAIEYPFWTERYPEALALYGEPLLIDNTRGCTPGEWTAQITRRLEDTQDELASKAIARHAHAFETLVGGRSGVGGVYDLWRTVNARMRGRSFSREHGSKAN